MKRIGLLDALGAFAVLPVIGHHKTFQFRSKPVNLISAIFKRARWIGVEIFFAISGYLITRILLERTYDLRTFFRRRAYRILPIFLVAICIFVIASLVTNTDRELLTRIWSPLLFLNGWTIPIYGYDNVPYTITWSLSVEETAYILLGLASLAGRVGLKTMVFAMIFTAVLVRILAVATGFVDLTDMYFFVPARLDAIAAGSLVAFGYFSYFTQGRWTTGIAALTVGSLVYLYQFFSISGAFLPLVGYLLFSCAMAILIASQTADRPQSTFLQIRPISLVFGWLVSFGKVSYFIYLFHIFVLEGILLVLSKAGLEKPDFWPAFVLAVFTVYLLALSSWKYFEHPLIQRGRHSAAERHYPIS